MSESRIQNHESGHISGQNSESKVMSLVVAWSGSWSRWSIWHRTHDSWFWILDFPRAMASSSRIMSTVEGSRWTRADLKIVHENLASASDKSTQKSRSTYDLPRIMMRHSNSLPFPSEFKANFSTRPPLDCDKSMEQNPKPQECENWECKISWQLCN